MPEWDFDYDLLDRQDPLGSIGSRSSHQRNRPLELYRGPRIPFQQLPGGGSEPSSGEERALPVVFDEK